MSSIEGRVCAIAGAGCGLVLHPASDNHYLAGQIIGPNGGMF